MSLFFGFFERKLRRQAFAAAGTGLVAALVAGCGNGYRPVVTPISPTGPAAQPASYAVVVSSPSSTSPGVANIIDYSGDTIVAQATIGTGPLGLTLDETGSNVYTYNSDGTVTNFAASDELQTKNVTYSTLPTDSNPVSFFSPSSGLWAADLTGNAADIFAGVPAVFKLSVPVDNTPVMVAGPATVGQRNYVITQGGASSTTCNNTPTAGPTGTADGVEVASDTVSSSIPVGTCPVFAIQASNESRLFVLNRGSDTISVINTQLNTADSCTPFDNQAGQLVTCHPTIPLSTAAVTATGIQPVNPSTANLPALAGPVYAEYNAATSQLVVADYDGGYVSIIDVSQDVYGNDSSTFGTTYTVKVGNTATPNPASVTVLSDGSRAYTANQNDDSTGNGSGNGTVSVIDLSSHTLEKTIVVTGHPRTVVSTANSDYSKVYVAAPDSPYLTIIESTPTIQDIVDTTVLVEGNVVDVRATTQTGSTGNIINSSRMPGYGQPCNLSAQQLTAAGVSAPTLSECRAQSETTVESLE
jgi:DNA-binding beta-propeller fold protein YncE